MDEIEYKFPYWGPLVMETKVEPEFVDILLEKGNESREKNLDNRKQLAGMIDEEFYYPAVAVPKESYPDRENLSLDDYTSWFVPRFTPYLNAYITALKTDWSFNLIDEKLISWSMGNLWINYQKAREYNPPHHHTDDLSFIIYLQVPDELKKENEEMRGVHNNDGPGTVCFTYGEARFPSLSYFARLPEVGDIFVFPSWLNHYVHAFKSDVERISVSGNVSFEMKKEMGVKNY